MTRDERRAWITSRLDPIEDYDPSLANPLRSDFDLNPGLKFDNPHALRPAAVLVGLIEHEEGLTVLLTRRSDTLRSHTGQIAFPGGRCDPGETPWVTALREANEEVGLDPACVTLAGLLHGYQTVTGFHVTPVVGFIDPRAKFTPSPEEVADVFETPFDFLMDPANHQRQYREAPGGRRHFYAMPWNDRFIWGATAGMLRSLYERLHDDAPEALTG
ncbi:CoA pyrophosphatase [Caulobacter segnis]|uniref:CoA pyrophosphatase n=1 Tax=Caulobacter segnis TaxID=88688 RepID=UPI0028559919|nr:CoA pyrophosphatase [Caulobacter segnis]MDR6624561.1 8-oxo-dGTP pyrophosphatase MutT (NUDIX family) [Caulobacter segnis]